MMLLQYVSSKHERLRRDYKFLVIFSIPLIVPISGQTPSAVVCVYLAIESEASAKHRARRYHFVFSFFLERAAGVCSCILLNARFI